MRIVAAVPYVLEPMSATEFFADETRYGGVHISDITRARDMEVNPSKYRNSSSLEMTPRQREAHTNWTEAGWLWEIILQHGDKGGGGFRNRMLRRRQRELGADVDLHLQPTFVRSGIGLSPDGMHSAKVTTGEEYKATRISIIKFQSSFDPWEGDEDSDWPGFNPGAHRTFFEWWDRIKCYAHVYGITRYRLFVHWIMGDWAGSGPQTWHYEIRFDKEELAEHWKSILKFAAEHGLLDIEAVIRRGRGESS